VDRRGKGRHVDGDAPDPRAADSELAIRYGTGHYPGFVVERLLAPDWVPVCSPRLANGERPLRSPHDLARHVLIHDETIDGEGRQPGWREWLTAAGVSGVDSERGPRFNNAVLAVEAALDGQGVALALRPLVEADLAAGRLILPFDLAVPSPFAYFLVMRRPLPTGPRSLPSATGCCARPALAGRAMPRLPTAYNPRLHSSKSNS
jgi:LysR family glycine cleavage system transcriptional activator